MNRNPSGMFSWSMKLEFWTNVLISRYTLAIIDTTKTLILAPSELSRVDVVMLSNVNRWASSSSGMHSLTEK